MNLRDLYDNLGDQEWLDGIADVVQPAVRGFFDALGPARRSVRTFSTGPGSAILHQSSTDLPIGRTTTPYSMHCIEDTGDGRRGHGRRAGSPRGDASLALGLAGAIGSAVTGLTDWSETDARRAGRRRPRAAQFQRRRFSRVARLRARTAHSAGRLAVRDTSRSARRGTWAVSCIHEQIGVFTARAVRRRNGSRPSCPKGSSANQPKRVLFLQTRPRRHVRASGASPEKARRELRGLSGRSSTFELATGEVIGSPSAAAALPRNGAQRKSRPGEALRLTALPVRRGIQFPIRFSFRHALSKGGRDSRAWDCCSPRSRFLLGAERGRGEKVRPRRRHGGAARGGTAGRRPRVAGRKVVLLPDARSRRGSAWSEDAAPAADRPTSRFRPACLRGSLDEYRWSRTENGPRLPEPRSLALHAREQESQRLTSSGGIEYPSLAGQRVSPSFASDLYVLDPATKSRRGSPTTAARASTTASSTGSTGRARQSVAVVRVVAGFSHDHLPRLDETRVVPADRGLPFRPAAVSMLRYARAGRPA